MLTADLVRARRRGTELQLLSLSGPAAAAARELATALIDATSRQLGASRDELDELCDALIGGARDRRLAAGLRKLVLDRCELSEDSAQDPVALRREVHERARRAYLELAERPGERFDRARVLAEVAAERGLEVDALEAGLYADLRGAQLLRSFAAPTVDQLLEEYQLAQAQAVLLRAVRVSVTVRAASAGAYRTLFRKLKFLRLLPAISRDPEGGYLIEIDGPFSLFESATRYGLALALALPAIRELDEWKLTADVRWGPERTPLTYRAEGTGAPAEEPRLPDELAALLAQLSQDGSPWLAAAADTVLDLPGVGVCVPDLVLRPRAGGREVFVEVLGYWSRAAVWRRVELVQRGLAEPVVFAVGQHLRVSEAALEDELPGALYVYKRTMSASALLERVAHVAAQAPPRPETVAAPRAQAAPRRPRSRK